MVVLPAPLTPSRPKHSPWPMAALRPATAGTGSCPWGPGYDFTMLSNSTWQFSGSTPAQTKDRRQHFDCVVVEMMPHRRARTQPGRNLQALAVSCRIINTTC